MICFACHTPKDDHSLMGMVGAGGSFAKGGIRLFHEQLANRSKLPIEIMRVRRAAETLVPIASHSCTHVDELGTNQVHPIRKLNSTNRTHFFRAHSSMGFRLPRC
jgi:hypothetical protein